MLRQACPEPVEGLSTNGEFLTIATPDPFALSLSKGERKVIRDLLKDTTMEPLKPEVMIRQVEGLAGDLRTPYRILWSRLQASIEAATKKFCNQSGHVGRAQRTIPCRARRIERRVPRALLSYQRTRR